MPASRIAGNVGMLGADHDGYLEPGDAEGLDAMLEHCRDDPETLARLDGQCEMHAPLFEPNRERTNLLAMLADMLKAAH